MRFEQIALTEVPDSGTFHSVMGDWREDRCAQWECVTNTGFKLEIFSLVSDQERWACHVGATSFTFEGTISEAQRECEARARSVATGLLVELCGDRYRAVAFQGTSREYEGLSPIRFIADFPLFLIREAWEGGADIEDLADGYGVGAGTGGDWSGIRDSSAGAITAMLQVALNHLFPERTTEQPISDLPPEYADDGIDEDAWNYAVRECAKAAAKDKTDSDPGETGEPRIVRDGSGRIVYAGND